MPVLLYSISEPWKINLFLPGKKVVHKICAKMIFVLKNENWKKNNDWITNLLFGSINLWYLETKRFPGKKVKWKKVQLFATIFLMKVIKKVQLWSWNLFTALSTCIQCLQIVILTHFASYPHLISTELYRMLTRPFCSCFSLYTGIHMSI